MNLNNALYIMIFLRLLSSLMEMGAAFLMYYFKNVATAIKINAILGLVGPLILLLVTFVGLVEIRDRLEKPAVYSSRCNPDFNRHKGIRITGH